MLVPFSSAWTRNRQIFSLGLWDVPTKSWTMAALMSPSAQGVIFSQDASTSVKDFGGKLKIILPTFWVTCSLQSFHDPDITSFLILARRNTETPFFLSWPVFLTLSCRLRPYRLCTCRIYNSYPDAISITICLFSPQVSFWDYGIQLTFLVLCCNFHYLWNTDTLTTTTTTTTTTTLSYNPEVMDERKYFDLWMDEISGWTQIFWLILLCFCYKVYFVYAMQ